MAETLLEVALYGATSLEVEGQCGSLGGKTSFLSRNLRVNDELLSWGEQEDSKTML